MLRIFSPRRRRGRGGKKINNLCELCVSAVNSNSDIITAEAQRTQSEEIFK